MQLPSTHAGTIEWSTWWSAVSAIATLMTVAAIGFAIRQLRFEAWIKAEELFRSFHQQRARVLARLPQRGAPWGEDEKENALDVCRRMNAFSYLLRFLPKSEALDHWDDPLAKTWIVLKPVLREERDRTNWNSKWKHFETWGEVALKKLIQEGRDPRWTNQHESEKPS